MGHLNPYLECGIYNWADYFTRHHTADYHEFMRYKYLQKLHMATNQILSTHLLQFALQSTQCVRVC